MAARKLRIIFGRHEAFPRNTEFVEKFKLLVLIWKIEHLHNSRTGDNIDAANENVGENLDLSNYRRYVIYTWVGRNTSLHRILYEDSSLEAHKVNAKTSVVPQK